MTTHEDFLSMHTIICSDDEDDLKRMIGGIGTDRTRPDEDDLTRMIGRVMIGRAMTPC
jgi:hypothetical protein